MLAPNVGAEIADFAVNAAPMFAQNDWKYANAYPALDSVPTQKEIADMAWGLVDAAIVCLDRQPAQNTVTCTAGRIVIVARRDVNRHHVNISVSLCIT